MQIHLIAMGATIVVVSMTLTAVMIKSADRFDQWLYRRTVSKIMKGKEKP